VNVTEVRLFDEAGKLKHVFRWEPAGDRIVRKLSPAGDALRVDGMESIVVEGFWYLVPKPQSGRSRLHTEAEASANGGVARKPLQAPYPLNYDTEGRPHLVRIAGRDLLWDKVVAELDRIAAIVPGPGPLELPAAVFMRHV
jgi:hypothetical protein